MEKIGRGKRASENQKEYLINFLEENIDIANDKFVTADGAKLRDQKWKKLALGLNALGGTMKDGVKWRKYWSDLRLHTRSKYIAIKEVEQRRDVNGLCRVKPLSSLEERIIKIAMTEASEVDFKHIAMEQFMEQSIDLSQPVEVKTVYEISSNTTAANNETNAVPITADGDEASEVDFEHISMEQFREQSIDLSEPVEVKTEYEISSNTTAANNAMPIIINETSYFAKTRGSSLARARKHKRKTRPNTTHLEKLLKIEEKKLAQMEMANNLKRKQLALQMEQLEATKKQTDAINCHTHAKENILARLKILVDVFGK